MTFKTLLLGSAAALLTVGGAQAADAIKAEPVSYVKVCDAFGAGYWYSPGTQTCLRIGGYVREDISFGKPGGTSGTNPYGVTSAPGGQPYITYANHEFITTAAVNFTAKSMTEMGALTGFVSVALTSGNASPATSSSGNGQSFTSSAFGEPVNLATLDEAYIEWGPFLAGYTGSLYAAHGGLPLIAISPNPTGNVDQLRFSFASGPIGIKVGLEDYRQKDTMYGGTGANPSTGIYPDLTAQMTLAVSPILGLQFAAGYGDRQQVDTWGALASAEVKLDAITKGDLLRLSAWYSAHGGDWAGGASSITTGGTLLDTNSWAFMGQLRHFIIPAKLNIDLVATYVTDNSTSTIQDGLNFEAGFTYVAATNLNIRGAYIWNRGQATAASGFTSSGQIRIERNFP